MDDGSEGTRVRNIRIFYDSRRDGLVFLIIHELLHIYLEKSMKMQARFSADLEEAAVVSLEKALYNYLQLPASEHLLESWNNAIKRKMER